jgi:hypothetical protein
MSYRNTWAGVMANGQRYLDAVIPPQLVAARLKNEQTLTLINGSVLRFLSSDQPDRLRSLALLVQSPMSLPAGTRMRPCA